jgi:Zn-dependent protease
VLRFALFSIPISVHWWFWLAAAVFGGAFGAQRAEDFVRAGLFVCAAFLSLLVHELAHALTGRRFGARPSILLHGLGGTTYLANARLSRRQSVLVSLAGPVAGFALGGILLGLAPWVPARSALGVWAVSVLTLVNLGWSVFNLLPILPMDGGQILRELAGPRRTRMVRLTGLIAASLAGAWALSAGQWVLAILMGVLAWQNYTGERRMSGGVERS